MKTKELVIMSLFVGIGAALHFVIPGIGAGGMKPDFSLLMMFLALILFPNFKNALLLGLATGIISGLTTTVPGGLIPNIIDKFFTAIIFFAFLLLIKKYRTNIVFAVLTAVGTIISGTLFLVSAKLIIQFSDALLALFGAIVLPTAALNTLAMVIMYPIVASIAKRSKIKVA
jgi:hypothetical protein